ncbi:MAG: ribonuclease J [Bacilli bacterium]
MEQDKNQSQKQNNYVTDIGNYPVKVVALGGLDEMGKNCYVIEVNKDVFIIEAGLKYPNATIPGVDTIIPDFDYLRGISNRVKAIIITHGHDDQYGALPYLLNIVRAPIYASATTIAIIKAELGTKSRKINDAQFVPVEPSSTANISGHVFEFFQTTHSVAGSFGFALATPFGNIVYTSDFISDYSPLKGFQFDLPKVARLSENQKTFLLMTESEAADKPGIASPNHKITDQIKEDIEDAKGKTFISIYSQNFYNIQEIINLAKRFGKKICIANPEQIPFFNAMGKIGSIVIPDDMRIDPNEMVYTDPKNIIVLITGSGDKLFNYCKEICYGNVNNIKVNTNDTWIIACPPVPGTEVAYTDASDTIYRTDCHVLAFSRKKISSMHAQQEDLKMMISLFRPKYYMPVKGEFRLLMDNAKLAIDLGIGLNHFNTFVYDNGMALAFDNNGNVIRKMINVKNGDVMVDGSSVGDVKEPAIEERTEMADGGVVLIGLSISSRQRKIVSSPDVQMRGFLYLKDSEPIINQITTILLSNVNAALGGNNRINLIEMDKKISEKVSKSIFKQTEKQPAILCEILDVDSLEQIDPK